MQKEEFVTRLIEQQVFDELKDGYFGGINYIRTKYEGSGIDFSRLYRRIINWRIKEYGTAFLESPAQYTYYTKEDRLKQAVASRQRRYYRRKNEK